MARKGQTSVRIVPHALALMVLCACGGDSSSGAGGGPVTPPATPAPAGLAYSENPAVYVVANAIVPNVPSSSGGPVTSYAVWPPLPAGLKLDRSSGVISGTPNDVTAVGSYHVTAVNGGGLATASIRITIKAEGTDAAPPKLVELSMAPATIDTGTQDQIVRVTARLTDDLAGVSERRVVFRSPTGKTVYVGSTRISGDALDGTYTFVVGVPRYAGPGTWHLERVELADSIGNAATFPEEELIARGYATTFVNVGSESDTVAPRLLGLLIAPSEIDASAQAQVVTVAARFTDDASGVISWEGSVTFVSTSGRHLFGFPTLDSGDGLDGIYTFRVEVPRYSEPGTWHLDRIRMLDRAGNEATFGEQQVVALGIPTTFVNVGTPGDTSAPRLLALSIAPARIDTRAGVQVVTLTARLTDDLSGVDPLGAVVVFDGPSGTTSLGADPSLVWGDGRDGIYTFTLKVPQYAEFGTRQLRELTLRDEARNWTVIPGAELAALGFPTTFVNGP
ncbi:Ig domain-containing protein [Anaeromyxobacter sp. Red801]|uniref:Ig domain-containing protein n=1 Tax=Anaeromyxobacter sp. Red801 TaxID=3411632 RepID=UPI003BA33098